MDGSGFPLTFIHGLGSSHKIWEHQIPKFANEFLVLAADNRYHGLSRAEDGVFKAYDIEQLASDWIDLLKSKLDRETYVVGLSMGSALAMQMAVEAPELISGLVLVEPWAYCDDEHRSRLENWIEMLSEKQDVNLFSEDLIRHYFSAPFIRNSPEEIKFYENIRNEQSLAVNLQDCKACLALDLRHRLSEINVPTVLIYGEFDVLIPPYHSRLLKREIPQSVEVRIKDCGHMPFIECPGAFNHIVRQCVKSAAQGEIPSALNYQESGVCFVEAPR
jgi:3-oxoadipate enol-lactonase